MTSTDLSEHVTEILYQTNPRKKSIHLYSKSKTESLESFHRAALQEYGALVINGTIPNHIVQLNYLKVFPIAKIRSLWKTLSRCLRYAGVIARVSMENTKDKSRKRPVNRIHYHFVVQDHKRTHDELKKLFEEKCLRLLYKSDFKVHVFPFDEAKGGWKGYIGYFLKLRDKDNNILFESGFWLRNYYTIGNWWTYPDGNTPRKLGPVTEKGSILWEMQRYAIKKRHQESEKLIPVERRPPAEDIPTDFARLKALLDRETDETLYDWISILLGVPTLFNTDPPEWLLFSIQSQYRKSFELMVAIWNRLKNTQNLSIILAFEFYYGIESDKFTSAK